MNFTPSSTLLFLFFLLSIIIIIITISILFNKRRRSRPKSTPNHNQQIELEQNSPATWLLPSSPPPPLIEDNEEDAAASGGGGGGGGVGGGEEKRRKKKAKKKRGAGDCPERDQAAAATTLKLGAAGCPFLFSSPLSAMQRKVKAQYDELVKSNQAKQLTMAQIYKLEAEQKRLEEDVAVYNLLQEQLKLSPAYKTMLEVGTRMELQGNQDQSAVDFCDISFEELLAQEKKDSFWQRNGKLRSFAS